MKVIFNKIQAIKELRQYTQDQYGVTCGLLEAKQAIESVMEKQRNCRVSIPVDALAKLLEAISPYNNSNPDSGLLRKAVEESIIVIPKEF